MNFVQYADTHLFQAVGRSMIERSAPRQFLMEMSAIRRFLQWSGRQTLQANWRKWHFGTFASLDCVCFRVELDGHLGQGLT